MELFLGKELFENWEFRFRDFYSNGLGLRLENEADCSIGFWRVEVESPSGEPRHFIHSVDFLAYCSHILQNRVIADRARDHPESKFAIFVGRIGRIGIEGIESEDSIVVDE